MSQRPVVKPLVRRWPTLILMTLLGIGLAVLYLNLATPRYSAHADVLVSPPAAKSTDAVSERTLESYAHVLGGRSVATRVIEDLGLPGSTRSVDQQLSARVLDGTSVLRVSADSSNREQAAELSQSAAEAFVAWLGAQDTDLSSAVVTEAVAPTDPSSPARTPWLVAGGLLGLLAGLLVAAARNAADRSIHSPAELEEASGAPVLGAIAYDRAAVQTPLITSLGTHHPRFEAVRILRTNLQFLDIDRDNKVITITSSLAGEGKSTTACNLAIALAQAGSQVALVEGDLRRPRVSEYLGIEKSVGLTTVLVGRVSLDAALQQAATPGLDVLASGSLPPNPSEILQTNAMRSLVSELRHRYDIVLIDAPPLLPVTDASLLASISDGAILVVRHGETGLEEVRTATARLSSVGARLLGTVLSMSPVKELSRYGYGYGYGYGPEYFEKATTGRKRRRG
ncbi:polysaccharide biosynthesis tyrosine autokinase [Aeromicrobium sp. NPDC092404]|uniref:polysaccharide biosynthesis tyrosine autokinase n=1 Tax=Aeromicrobium sp. NPDC092404 TaxID=3154976 RepID=UPI003435D811